MAEIVFAIPEGISSPKRKTDKIQVVLAGSGGESNMPAMLVSMLLVGLMMLRNSASSSIRSE
jgi:hypothetical protein